jgi:hypothetical protein
MTLRPKKRKYDSLRSQDAEFQSSDAKSQEDCEEDPAKYQEYDITSDNEEFDDGTDVEEDDENDNDLDLSNERYEVHDILGRRVLVRSC